MEVTVYNCLKQRLETIDLEFNEENTTWFDECLGDHDIHMITDVGGGLLISEQGYTYPLWVDSASRAAVGYNRHKAVILRERYLNND